LRDVAAASEKQLHPDAGQFVVAVVIASMLRLRISTAGKSNERAFY
jgi:hypothetical protein